MTTLREYLSILPEWEATPGGDVDIPERWWNWHREWNDGGPEYRYRVVVGDLCADAEHESGDPSGFMLVAEFHLYENTGQFDERDFQPTNGVRVPGRRFGDHSFSVVVGRWGIYIALRGREIR